MDQWVYRLAALSIFKRHSSIRSKVFSRPWRHSKQSCRRFLLLFLISCKTWNFGYRSFFFILRHPLWAELARNALMWNWFFFCAWMLNFCLKKGNIAKPCLPILARESVFSLRALCFDIRFLMMSGRLLKAPQPDLNNRLILSSSSWLFEDRVTWELSSVEVGSLGSLWTIGCTAVILLAIIKNIKWLVLFMK